MHSFKIIALTLALGTTAAFADATTDRLVQELQTDGYTRIEVKTGPTQTKVEAIRGTEKVEFVYDNATGTILKREVDTLKEQRHEGKDEVVALLDKTG